MWQKTLFHREAAKKYFGCNQKAERELRERVFLRTEHQLFTRFLLLDTFIEAVTLVREDDSEE